MTRWIHGISLDLLRTAFRDYFGVSDEHVEVLALLYGRPGEWTRASRLQVLLNSHRPPKRQAIYERIRVLREAMEAESLLSGGQLDDLGYALSEVGYAECANALRALAQTLLRNGPMIAIPASDDIASPISADPAVLHEALAELDAERRLARGCEPVEETLASRRSLRTVTKAAS